MNLSFIKKFESWKGKKKGYTGEKPFDTRMPPRVWLTRVLSFSAFFCMVGWIFYGSLLAALLLLPLGLLAPLIQKGEWEKKRKSELSEQFKQAIYAISSSLSAGKSVENAFRDAYFDLNMLYPDPKTPILREIALILKKMEHGESLELALTDFGKRSGVEEIIQFADVFVTCKRTGGDLVEVIRRTSHILSEKMEIQLEIEVLIAQKKFEAKILAVMPFLIVAFLKFSSPDYVAPLYTGPGHLLMTFALLVLGFCWWLIRRLMDIRV